MGPPDFGRSAPYPAPPLAHALNDDEPEAEAEVQPEPEAEVQPEPALPLGCRWRVPLTRVLNPSGVLLLYRDQLDAQTSDQVIIC